MKPIEIKRELEAHLQNENWITSYDRDNDTFRIVDERVDKGITVRLGNLTDKFKEDKDAALEGTVAKIKEGMRLLVEKADLNGKEKNIFPVLRTPGFGEGKQLLSDEHTAETKIFYAVDEGASYSMIDEEMLKQSGKTGEEIRETAQFNVRALPSDFRMDEAAGNKFYFLHAGDGYEASRILDEQLLEKMKKEIEGEMAVAVPHHDMLVIADLRNEAGYDVLGQMTFQFFAEGHVPLTALPFLYENGELEPIFILAQKKPKNTKNDG
ncbi:DUF1444 family protein [Alkalicoccus saliphilus]|jgi:uncharacterized protein YtpQ (UPF0354 family)|uniref:DUF1444 domain-containing protein n=1 Tax=Alkalicoccus saliphilus TaxID=200989 RepID=A0A2T4U8U9_9BACI|nr:DUF1444 family protein [Alkalicoccus saliphilus]PTL39810.1 DUF1444 domain-containing protein [Alkalicoccus saliphilus]